MGNVTRFAWSVGIYLGLIALIDCVPLEIVYTGDGCECPKQLGYEINLPKLPKSRKYTPNEYGYKIEAPATHTAKARVSYSFDFTVEEPAAPKPVKPSSSKGLNLFAKVDRIALNKPDCLHDYYPTTQLPLLPPPPPSTSCQCSHCGVAKPHYRYVYKKLQPCKCQQSNCKCNLRRTHSSNSLLRAASAENSINQQSNFKYNLRHAHLPNYLIRPSSAENKISSNSIRRKRDLRRLFHPRKLHMKRPGRSLKLYHKNLALDSRKSALSDVESVAEPVSHNKKRKTKKFLDFPMLHANKVKRDIKGEYDLLEKEREDMDLTLPEIIQFMPETLQADFKKGACNFGCNDCQQKSEHSQEFKESNENIDLINAEKNTKNTENTENIENIENIENEQTTEENLDEKLVANLDTENNVDDMFSEKEKSSENSIGASFTKRNAGNYHYGSGLSPAQPYTLTTLQLPSFTKQNAYNARAAQSLSIYPTQKTVYSASSYAKQQQPKYVYDRVNQKYLANDKRLHLFQAPAVVSDPFGTDATQLQYAGDLETPQGHYRSHQSAGNPNVGARNYPVHHVSSDRLDKIISDIVHRHPDFIDASSHYGGALVDPEPYQEQQTKAFLKKLIDGRLSSWFGDENEYAPYHAMGYGSPYNPYNTPPRVSYLPLSY